MNSTVGKEAQRLSVLWGLCHTVCRELKGPAFGTTI